MNVINLNIRGLSSNWNDVVRLSSEADIICLSEIMLTYRRSNIDMFDFNHIRKDRRDGIVGGGMVTYVRKNIQYMSFNLNGIPNNVEYIACRIYKDYSCYNLVSIYIPPSLNIGILEFQSIFDSLVHIKNLILTGDFNVHNIAWHSQ